MSLSSCQGLRTARESRTCDAGNGRKPLELQRLQLGYFCHQNSGAPLKLAPMGLTPTLQEVWAHFTFPHCSTAHPQCDSDPWTICCPQVPPGAETPQDASSPSPTCRVTERREQQRDSKQSTAPQGTAPYFCSTGTDVLHFVREAPGEQEGSRELASMCCFFLAWRK